MDTILMSEQEYIDSRVNDQINWYESKSGWNKRMYTRLKFAETIIALLIPFLTGYIATGTNGVINPLALKITIGLLGVSVAALTGLITFNKFQENWIQYRSISELLKHEKYLYVTRSGPYKEMNALQFFVERFENYISKENTQWAAYAASKDGKKETEKNGAIVAPVPA